MLKLRYSSAVLVLSLSLPSWAGVDLSAKVPVGPQVKVGKLDNGLTYYIQRNGKPAQHVEMRLAIKAGSVLEDEDQRGLAHFVEHMAFNGSTHFEKNQLIDFLQSIGVRFGADLNAYTSMDETVYILPIPSKNPEHVRKGFQVLEDWAHGIKMLPADIDAERAIILEELRKGKGAMDRVGRKILPYELNGSRYAQRLPSGDETVLKTFKPETLRRFYQDWYRPDLMAVAVVGDIDPQEAEQLIRSHFGKLKNPATPRPRSLSPVPDRSKTEVVIATDKELPGQMVQLQLALYPNQREGSYGEQRSGMLDRMTMNILNQRYAELTQLANPPFLGGGMYRGPLVRSSGQLRLSASVGKPGAVPAVRTLLTEVERVRQHGFSAAELERQKRSMLTSLEHAVKEKDKAESATLVAEYLRNFLNNEPIPGIEAEAAYKKQMLEALTLDELNAHARQILQADAAQLISFIGSAAADSPVPSEAELLAAASSAPAGQLAKHEEKAVASKLMDRPAAGAIVAETKNAALGTTTLRLANGIEIILRPTDFHNDQIMLSGSRFGGAATFADADLRQGALSMVMSQALGLKQFAAPELQKMLAGRRAGANVMVQDHSDSVMGAASKADIELMLQMVHMRFGSIPQQPALFQSMIERQGTALRSLMNSPETYFQNQVALTLYGQHPRSPLLPTLADLQGLDLARAGNLFQQRFASAQGFRFAMVGNFDVDAVKPLLAAYLGNLPMGTVNTALLDNYPQALRGVHKKEVLKGSENKAILRMAFIGNSQYDSKHALHLEVLNEILNIKFNEVLREKEQLVYSGGVRGGLSRFPSGRYENTLNFPCAPENTDKVADTALAEIRKVQEQGPTAADLAKAKAAMQLVYERNLKENGYWLSGLLNAAMWNEDPQRLLTRKERIEAVTAADIQAAAKRYYDMQNYVQFALKPEAKS